MNQIAPHLLWIGHAGDGRNLPAIFEADIRAIVQLAAEEPALQPPRELVCLRYPLLDGPGNDPAVLRLARAAIATLLREGLPTLVCCGAGMSRSPALAAAGLSAAFNMPLDAALAMTTRKRPADVSPGLLLEVEASLQNRRAD